MNLKTFRAPSMAQALSDVKAELGKDAVILYTRVHTVGAVLGIGGKQIVEITAADEMSARGPRLRDEGNGEAGKETGKLRPGSPAEFIASAFSEVEAPAAAGETPVVRVRPVKPDELRRPASAPTAREGAVRVPADLPPLESPNDAEVVPPPSARLKSDLATRAPFAPVNGAAAEALAAEFASIRGMLNQIWSNSFQTMANVAPHTPVISVGGGVNPLLSMYLKLQEALVAPAIIEDIAASVRSELSADEVGNPEVVRQGVLRHLAGRLPVVGQVSKAGPSEGGRPLTIALIGPTGVGKTTTIAKLAAAYKLRHGKNVGLITSDTYRIAAVEQLRTYATIIGLPLNVVMTPREMAAACSALAECDVILIDTAGRSQHDAGRLKELAAFLEACSPHETHLVLSAGAAEPVLQSAASRFGKLSPTSVIFSKLDEAEQAGPLVNVLSGLKLKVSYITTGQEVPDQIELAQSDRLARRVLDGSGCR